MCIRDRSNVEKDQILQNQLDLLEENIVEVENHLKVLRKEISPLEMEYESYYHLLNEDTSEIQTRWYVCLNYYLKCEFNLLLNFNDIYTYKSHTQHKHLFPI